MKTVAFIGTHPDDIQLNRCYVQENVSISLCNLINNDYTNFIISVERGPALWIAEEILYLKKEHQDLPLNLILAIPYRSFTGKWKVEDRQHYIKLLIQADGLYYQNEFPILHAFEKRNEWMIDRADLVVVVCTELYKGLTYRAIQYAHKKNVPVINIIDLPVPESEADYEYA